MMIAAGADAVFGPICTPAWAEAEADNEMLAVEPDSATPASIGNPAASAAAVMIGLAGPMPSSRRRSATGASTESSSAVISSATRRNTRRMQKRSRGRWILSTCMDAGAII